MAKKTLCQGDGCVTGATQTLSAAGTTHGYWVCSDPQHVQWAKQQLVADFPARTVEREAVSVADDYDADYDAEYDAARAEIRANNHADNTDGDDNTDGW